MTNEQILEIARRHTAQEEELLAFAQAVIEADRESSDEPVAWYDKNGMVTHDPFEGKTPFYTRPQPKSQLTDDRESGDEPAAWLTLGKDRGSDRDTVTFSKSPLIQSIPLYRRPQPKARLTDEEILAIATKSPPFIPWLLQEGVTLGDVRGMAVNFARAIEKKIWEKNK